jgi:hypothetical protein
MGGLGRGGGGGNVHACEAVEQRRHVVQRHAMIHVQRHERAGRHLPIQRVLRVLHDGDAAAGPYRPEPGRPVIHGPAQDNADHARSIRPGRGPKQRIYRGPMAVFAWAAHDTHAILRDEQVIVRGREVNLPMLNGIAVHGKMHGQGTLPAKDFVQPRIEAGREMLHDHDRRGQVSGQFREEPGESPDPARRSADRNNVARSHGLRAAVKASLVSARGRQGATLGIKPLERTVAQVASAA